LTFVYLGMGMYPDTVTWPLVKSTGSISKKNGSYKNVSKSHNDPFVTRVKGDVPGAIALNFTVDESLSWARYSLDAQEVVKIEGNITLVDLSYGRHNLTVFGTDTSGNTGSSETIRFTIMEEPEPFPTIIVAAAVVLVAVIGLGLVVYFKKRNKGPVR